MGKRLMEKELIKLFEGRHFVDIEYIKEQLECLAVRCQSVAQFEAEIYKFIRELQVEECL